MIFNHFIFRRTNISLFWKKNQPRVWNTHPLTRFDGTGCKKEKILSLVLMGLATKRKKSVCDNFAIKNFREHFRIFSYFVRSREIRKFSEICYANKWNFFAKFRFNMFRKKCENFAKKNRICILHFREKMSPFFKISHRFWIFSQHSFSRKCLQNSNENFAFLRETFRLLQTLQQECPF